MQSLTTNSATLSPQVQAILPVLENLKADDYYFLLNFLKNKSEKIEVKNSEEPSIAQKRYGRYRGQIQILEGFDDDLGDEF